MLKAFEPRKSRRSRKESGWGPEPGKEENDGNEGRKQGQAKSNSGAREDAKDRGREARESAATGDSGVTTLIVEKQGELANLQNGIRMSHEEAEMITRRTH
jgi:hypothetical protein